MSKLTEHLGKHLRGEVLDTKSARDYFSTDGSIFKLQPHAIVYPQNVTDVRKVNKFSWQLAERGKSLPITSRGKGTDQGGAALGQGLIMVMPAHLNRLLDIDRDSVTVEPGMLYGDLQRTLHSHGKFLPPYPSSIEYSTVGGAVANNASGEKTLKYGSTADYVKELEVVLASGQVIRTRPLSKRELNRKKGQTDMEGDIYRAVDGLLLDNAELIEQARPKVSKNSAGYALWDVRRPDGSFDLSRLIVGSQGTLGTVTEITFATETYNPDTHLLVMSFDDLAKAGEAAQALRQLKPSAMEVVDYHLLDFLRRHQPSQVEDIIEDGIPKIMFLVEFDEDKVSARKRNVKKAQKIVRELATNVRTSTDVDEQDVLWKVRRGAAAIMWMEQGKKKALPFIEDGVVPSDKVSEFIERSYELFDKYDLDLALWGHIGDGNFHMQPFLDLSNATDRQTVFKLMDDFYQMIFELGGSTTGEHNDGRLRGPYLRELYGSEMYELFRKVKDIFDPHNILNPGVKIDVDKDALKKQLRHEHNIDHLYDHMPKAHH